MLLDRCVGTCYLTTITMDNHGCDNIDRVTSPDMSILQGDLMTAWTWKNRYLWPDMLFRNAGVEG